jgi:CO/xanthine dehydrogenase FAD-binding subunit
LNLNTILEVKRPKSADEIAHWRTGYAWLAGGTWLFSEPQVQTDTLIDLAALRWPALEISPSGLTIAATCTVADLYAFQSPATWTAGALIGECCRSFLSSFKIWNEATVGGNICMSLPAGPMISLTTALEGVYELWPREGAPRSIAGVDFVTGNNRNVLQPGELLRSIHLPVEALAKTFAFRRSTLTHLGRSAVLMIGTRDSITGAILMTITAATLRPVQMRFETPPTAQAIRDAIDAAVSDDLYLADAHGSPAYRRHLTYYFAEEIRRELSA